MYFSVILFIHIIAGSLVLIFGITAFLIKAINWKHNLHIISGKIFFTNMLIALMTAILLSIYIHSLFLFLIAIFSLYLVATGRHYAANKKGKPYWYAWLQSTLMIFVSLALTIYGCYLLYESNDNGVTSLVFGCIGFVLSLRDLLIFSKGGLTGNQRLAKHLAYMLASMIAAITAFLIVNFTIKYQFILWLLPTVIISPAIIYFESKVKKGSHKV